MRFLPRILSLISIHRYPQFRLSSRRSFILFAEAHVRHFVNVRGIKTLRRPVDGTRIQTTASVITTTAFIDGCRNVARVSLHFSRRTTKVQEVPTTNCPTLRDGPALL